MFSGKTEMSFYVLFAQQRFSSWNSAMQAIFAQSLSYGGVGGGKHFFTQGHVGLDFVIKKTPSFKNCMLCLLVLSLINI